MLLVSLFVICCNVWAVHSTKTFYLGRRRGGNVAGDHLLSKEANSVETKWFNQALDHFNVTNNATWKQRYYVNSEYFADGGPVFLMVGGEGEAVARWLEEGAMVEYAKTHKALMFQLEHRYYGQSRPTVNLAIKNLKYLSSVQALEDIATFIKAMNKEYTQTSGRWVLFGGSYPGSLVAWARARFPDLVHASVSSSGPLLAVADFKDYFLVIANALNETNSKCLSSFATAQEDVKRMLLKPTGQKTLSKVLRLCSPINASNPLDVQSFFESLANNVAGIDQYNKDNRFHKDVNLTITDICDIMTDATKSAPLKRLARLNDIILDQSNLTCLDYTYSKSVDDMRNTSWDAETAEGGRQWFYQTCTEFGFYQTSTLPITQKLFGDFPLDLFLRQCKDTFGSKFNKNRLYRGIEVTNNRYNGLSYATDRVVFVHGMVDPWHALGITNSSDPRMPSILIQGTAHCADMYPSAKTDLPQLQAARRRITSLIGQWIRE